MASVPLVEQLAERLSHLEGWKESQERFAQQLATEIAQLGHRLERVEDAIKASEQRWDQRFDDLERRWDQRLDSLEQRWARELANLEQRWETRFSELTARLDRMEGRLDRLEGRIDGMENRWDSRFAELRRNFWWLMGFQFTILLAILALVARGL